MRRIIFVILVLFLSLPVEADMTLTGGVDYTGIGDELLHSKPANIPDGYADAAFDKQYEENMACLLNGKTELTDRTLALFSDGSYGVEYKNLDTPHLIRYYDKDGKLMNIELKDGADYPYKTYKYDISGMLVNMTYRKSKSETFIYTPGGKLLAHWVGPNAYDQYGNVIMTRKYLE